MYSVFHPFVIYSSYAYFGRLLHIPAMCHSTQIKSSHWQGSLLLKYCLNNLCPQADERRSSWCKLEIGFSGLMRFRALSPWLTTAYGRNRFYFPLSVIRRLHLLRRGRVHTGHHLPRSFYFFLAPNSQLLGKYNYVYVLIGYPIKCHSHYIFIPHIFDWARQ